MSHFSLIIYSILLICVVKQYNTAFICSVTKGRENSSIGQ